MKTIGANQKDPPAEMNDQQYKQFWRKSIKLVVSREQE